MVATCFHHFSWFLANFEEFFCALWPIPISTYCGQVFGGSVSRILSVSNPVYVVYIIYGLSVACQFGNSQSLESQSGSYSTIRNLLSKTRHSQMFRLSVCKEWPGRDLSFELNHDCLLRISTLSAESAYFSQIITHAWYLVPSENMNHLQLEYLKSSGTAHYI